MYEDHYGLTGRPFQLTPDPQFWYETATHRKAMAYLGYGLAQGEGFIVISGDIGAGKTTLVGHLMESVDREQLHAIRIVSTQIEPEDLLRQVAAGLDIAGEGLSKAALLQAIERAIFAHARAGLRTLLVVDEVQALPLASLEELRMLSNIQAGGHALLQIFLLGQPEFRDALKDPRLEQLRQRVIAMHHLGPMEPGEAEAYLTHRLVKVGWSGNPRFEPEAVAAMHRWSGGIPRRFNQLASRMLLNGAIEGLEVFTADTVAGVIGDIEGDHGTVAPTVRAPETSEPPLPEPLAPPVEAPVVAPAVVQDAAHLADDELLLDAVVEPAPLVIEAPEGAAPMTLVEWPIPRDAPAEDGLPRPIAGEGDVPPPSAAAPVPSPVEPEFTPVFIAVDDDPEAEFEPEPEIDGDPAPVLELEPETEAEAIGSDPDLHPADDVADAPPVAAAPAPDLIARIEWIERQLEEQDAALRRVLTLLVDWVEVSGSPPRDAAHGG